jgi:phosphonate metabolism protein PhnN/1,5-bisphosphokinase (PRPP-forming)
MLVLVVGPSGAGKDTLLAAVRQTLDKDHRFRFVRRTITRPADNGPERHEPVDEATFEARRQAGAFALTWRAQGAMYGVPADIAIDLAQGRVVVANVSRTLVGEAAQRWPPVRVIEIAVPLDLLARRLAAKGREDAVDVARRLARAVKMPPEVPRETVANDGTVEQGARRLIAALNRAAEAARQG